MSSRAITDLDERLQPLCQDFLDKCKADGIRAGIACTYRSNEEQDIDYAKGRTTPGPIITNAKAGQSPHNCIADDGTAAARAFDFFILDDNDNNCDWNAEDDHWRTAISIGESVGLVSGDTFPKKDTDHLELPNWKGAV